MKRYFLKETIIMCSGIFMSTLALVACKTDPDSPEIKIELEEVDSLSVTDQIKAPQFLAVVDVEAMDQVGQYAEVQFSNAFDLYHSGSDVVDRWTDKLWGRCCTEADLNLCEVMSFYVSASVETEQNYPFENALNTDDPYNTAYVFKEDDPPVIKIEMDKNPGWLGPWEELGPLPKIVGEDTLMTKFQFSLINGYVKSEQQFKENSRIEWVELWLNDSHMCNVKLLDIPDIQMIEGNFPFTFNDVVYIKPISFYEGSKYDDVCISALQQSLSFSCDIELIKKGDKIAGITWRGY